MTYAMTLDHSWEIMSEEEMYDVNGGVNLSTYWTGVAFDAAITLAGLWAAGKAFFSALTLAKAGRVYVRTNIIPYLIAVGISFLSQIVEGVMFVLGFISQVNSIGSALAHALDWADGSYDGRITVNFS